jgi:peptide/nickel transport system permease protein
MTVATAHLNAPIRADRRRRRGLELAGRLVRRLLSGLVVLWGAATLTFVALNLTGGDMAIAILGGPDALPTPAAIAQVRHDYGLDQPLPLQYLHYLGRLLHGDLGESYRLHIPVSQAIAEQIGATGALAGLSCLLAVVISVVTATLTARRAPALRRVANATELVLTSTPLFVLGIVLLLALSFGLHLFPVGGDHGWRSLVLPVLTIGIWMSALLTQVLRQSLEEVLEQPFILMARARGMSDAAVRLAHALRHACVPLITLAGFIFASLMSEAMIVETLFARPGVGRLLTDAATNSDVPVVVGVTLLAATTFVIVNLVVDALNALVDPRTVFR